MLVANALVPTGLRVEFREGRLPIQDVRVPVFFEPNLGQFPSDVQFAGRAGSQLFLFRADGFSLLSPHEAATYRFAGAELNEIIAESRLPGVSNYFVGGGSRWQQHIPHFSRVVYDDLYPGIDVTFYGREGRLEYDIRVQPWADPSKFQLENAAGWSLSGGVLKASGFSQLPPRVTAGAPPDGARWELTGSLAYIDVRGWNRETPLVVDPVITYSSYLPMGVDLGLAATASGGIVACGRAANGFSATPGSAFDQPIQGAGVFVDAAVMQLNKAADQVLFATFLGGSGTDEARDVAVGPQGDIYVVGGTESDDFPNSNGYQGGSDWFYARLSDTGDELRASRVSGGSGNETAVALSISDAGEAVVVGTTNSPDLVLLGSTIDPTLNGSTDGFVVKLSANSGVVFTTYLGGDGVDGLLQVYERDDRIYLLGFASNGFPVTPDAAYTSGPGALVVTDANGTEILSASRFPQSLYAFAVTDTALWVCANGNPGLETTPNAFADQPTGTEDVYLASFPLDLTELSYGSYIGGGESERCQQVLVSGMDVALMGTTTSLDLPLTEPLPDQPLLNGETVFVLWVRPDLQLVRKGAIYGAFYSTVYDAVLLSDGELVLGGLAFAGIDTTADALFPTGEDVTSYLLKSQSPPALPELSISAGQEHAVGQPTTITVTLDPMWPNDVEVALKSSDSSALYIPPSVVVGTSGVASIDTVPTAQGTVTVTATMPADLGSQSATVQLDIKAHPVGQARGCSCHVSQGRPSTKGILASLCLVGLLLWRRRRSALGEPVL